MTDDTVAETILRLVAARGEVKSVCPSEVARALAGPPGDWRGRMPHVRRVAGTLAAARLIAVTQRGQPVDAVTAHGPIRFTRRSG